MNWIVILLAVLIILALLVCIWSYKEGAKRGSITQEPIIPEWTLSSKITKETMGNATIYRKPYQKRYSDAMRIQEESKGAYNAVRAIIKSRTRGTVKIPTDTCMVQVPMAGFTCGRDPTDFEGPWGSLTYHYQMFGDDRIQVVTYTQDDIDKVAGYCVYIRSPYDMAVSYHAKFIDRCYQMNSMGNVNFDENEV